MTYKSLIVWNPHIWRQTLALLHIATITVSAIYSVKKNMNPSLIRDLTTTSLLWSFCWKLEREHFGHRVHQVWISGLLRKPQVNTLIKHWKDSAGSESSPFPLTCNMTADKSFNLFLFLSYHVFWSGKKDEALSSSKSTRTSSFQKTTYNECIVI